MKASRSDRRKSLPNRPPGSRRPGGTQIIDVGLDLLEVVKLEILDTNDIARPDSLSRGSTRRCVPSRIHQHRVRQLVERSQLFEMNRRRLPHAAGFQLAQIPVRNSCAALHIPQRECCGCPARLKDATELDTDFLGTRTHIYNERYAPALAVSSAKLFAAYAVIRGNMACLTFQADCFTYQAAIGAGLDVPISNWEMRR